MMLQRTLLLVTLVSMVTSAPAPYDSMVRVVTGDPSPYVDYYPGSVGTNVIISVPHDGHIKPSDIPHRQQGCYDHKTQTCDWRHTCQGEKNPKKCKVVTHADYLASKIAIEMRNAIELETGHKPHLIISRLHRSKLDPNRFREDAAQYNEAAGAAYDLFHGFIQKAHDQVTKIGPGLHFDVHGYKTHAVDNWVELGYNIRGSELNNNQLNPDNSSIRALASRSNKTFDSLVRGKDSLGWLFEQAVFRVVPSPRYPKPELGVQGKYFRGGYITRRWGSLEAGKIDCIQIEFPQWTRDEYSVHGPILGREMAKFVQENY